MKLAPLFAALLIVCLALPEARGAKGKKCKGKNKQKYELGKGYLDTKTCIQYTCVKKGRKLKMKGERMPKPCSGPPPTPPTPSIPQQPSTTPPPSSGGLEAMKQDIQDLKDVITSMQSTSNKHEISINNNTKGIAKNENTANHLGTCLSDVTSTYCPASGEGKMSVTEAIKENKDAIEEEHGSSVEGCLIEDKIDYFGNDISSQYVSGVDECANLCGRTGACKFWTFRKHITKCYLKTSDSGRQKSNNDISGAKSCATGPCPSGWTSLAKGCYKIVTTSHAVSYEGAMTKCKQEKGYLVEMDNQGEQDAIIQFLEENKINEHVWLGGTDADETGKWIGGYTGKEIMKFNGWDSESPSHVGSQHCILTDPSRKFKWNDYWCNSDSQGYRPKAALCEYSCPQGWTIFGDTCYRLFPQHIATYSSAEKKCQEFGGELVSLETEDENDFVEKMLNEARDDGILSVGASPHESTDIWLSARRPNTGSPFTWKTGPSLVFSDWHAGQPTATGLCMQTVRNSGSFWAWWSMGCDGDSARDNAVVCEKKIG